MDLYERCGNEIAAVLVECCTVEEVENTLAEINPEDWKRAAEKALQAANYQKAVEEAARLRAFIAGKREIRFEARCKGLITVEEYTDSLRSTARGQ